MTGILRKFLSIWANAVGTVLVQLKRTDQLRHAEHRRSS
jgi:hypothetical protein